MTNKNKYKQLDEIKTETDFARAATEELNALNKIDKNKPTKIREIEEVFIAVGNERANFLFEINHKGIEQFSYEELENIFSTLGGHVKKIDSLWREYDAYFSKMYPTREGLYKNLHPDYEKARAYGSIIIEIVNRELKRRNENGK